MNFLLRIAPWLILLISFVILAVFYNSLPNEILIARSFFGAEVVTAQKSLFTVFRVPLIETVCAAAVEVMRRRAVSVSADSALMWTVLLFTVALKSLFQSLETISSESAAAPFFYLTVGVVAAGIAAALFAGRKFFSKAARETWKLNASEKVFFVFLLLGYLGLAILPILVYK